MRTTLTIDDDILIAANGLAARERKTIGEVISALARQAVQTTNSGSYTRNGVPLPAVGNGALPVTHELVNQLRDELP